MCHKDWYGYMYDGGWEIISCMGGVGLRYYEVDGLGYWSPTMATLDTLMPSNNKWQMPNIPHRWSATTSTMELKLSGDSYVASPGGISNIRASVQAAKLGGASKHRFWKKVFDTGSSHVSQNVQIQKVQV